MVSIRVRPRWSTAVTIAAAAAACALFAAPSADAAPPPRTTPHDAAATFETPTVFDDPAGGNANADDPAIWYNSAAPEHSLVIATAKDAGLRVYRLDGSLAQSISVAAPGRLNNVDVLTGMPVDGHRIDVAIASDRGTDRLRVYRIRPDHPDAPLVEITDSAAPTIFQDPSNVDGETTAYGLAGWHDSRHGKFYALVTQAHRDTLALVELRATADGDVTYHTVRTLRLPDSFRIRGGGRWTPCDEPGRLPQAEGLVVDPRHRVLYASQETVGIWRIPADLSHHGRLIDKVRDFGVPKRYDPATDECVVNGEDPGVGGTHLTADAEGLALVNGRLIASSQGDNSYAVYRAHRGDRYLGSFQIVDGRVDGTQSTDGLTALDRRFGSLFPHGLLVIQDGADTPTHTGDDGEVRESTNLKFVDLSRVFR